MNKCSLDDFCSKFLIIPHTSRVKYYMGTVSRNLKDPHAPYKVEVYTWKIKLFKCNAYIPFRYDERPIKLIKG